jgi:hypothetical protein
MNKELLILRALERIRIYTLYPFGEFSFVKGVSNITNTWLVVLLSIILRLRQYRALY